MSDDWGSYRSGFDDEDEDAKDDADTGSDEPGGWPDDEPGAGKTHWPEDEPEPSEEPESGWPTSGSTWQRPEYGDTSGGWDRPEYGSYGRYGYLRDGRGPRRRASRSRIPHGTPAIRSPASFPACRAASGSRSTGSSPSPARS